eukprot:scaffold11633_cov33-Prasinocladus_malaysianus.AAC.1
MQIIYQKGSCAPPGQHVVTLRPGDHRGRPGLAIHQRQLPEGRVLAVHGQVGVNQLCRLVTLG